MQRKILVVDDNLINLQVLVEFLQHADYDVRVANNGALALTVAKNAKPDLVLLDIMMPEMNGYELCEIFKANPKTQDIPIIFMSALDGSEDEIAGLRLGAVDYITKPFKPEIVLARIKTHLSLRETRQQAEKNERKHKELLNQQSVILDNTVLGIALIEERIFKQVNRRLEELFGYAHGEMDGLSTRVVYDTPETYELVGEQAYATLVNHKRYSGEWRFKRKDGSLFWGMLEGQALDASHVHGGSIWLFRDITHRRKMEDDLRESQALFQAAFHNSGVGMAISQVQGLNFVEVNQALADMLGYSIAELLSMTVPHITHPDDLLVGVSEIQQILAGKKDSLQVEKRYQHRDGQILEVILSATVVRDKQQQPHYFISHYQNITERKKAELATIKANAELEARLEELSALNYISQTLATVHDLQAALENVAQIMTNVFHAHGTAIGILNERRTHIIIKAHFFYPNNDITEPVMQGDLIGLTLALADNPFIAETFEQKSTLIIPHPTTNPLTASIQKLMQERGTQELMSVPLRTRNTIIGLMFIGINEFERTFTAVEMSLAETIAGHIAGAIDSANLFQEEHRQRQVAESLRHVANILNSTLDQNLILQKIMGELSHVLRYDSAGIFLLQGNDLVLSADSRLLIESYQGTRVPLNSDNVVARVMGSTPPQPMLLPDVHRSPYWEVWSDGDGIQSWMGAPMLTGRKKIGVLTVDSHTLNFYSEADIQLLQAFANQAAIAIDNAQLFEETQRINHRLQTLNQKMQDELIMAKRIQRSLMPDLQPQWSALDVACFSSTASEVGGDFYTYHQFTEPNAEEPHYGIAVGDVSGKGMPAALMMSVSLASFKSVVTSHLSPKQLLRKLDRILAPYTLSTGQNCALVYVDITPLEADTYLFRIANGGCIAPMIKRHDGILEWVDVGGMPLGVGLGYVTGYRDMVTTLYPGDMMILTSDGVVEAYNPHGEMLGFEGLESLIEQGPYDDATEMLVYIQFELAAYIGNADAHDDFTVVVIKV